MKVWKQTTKPQKGSSVCNKKSKINNWEKMIKVKKVAYSKWLIAESREI